MVDWKFQTVDFLKFYLADFLIGVVLAIIGAGFSTVGPYNRFFLERDASLSYPWVQAEEVPVSLLAVVSVVLPFILIVITQISIFGSLKKFKEVDRPSSTYTHYIFMAWLSLAEACGINMFLTQAIKIFCGRKRPNFFAMCNYKGYRTALLTNNFTDYNANTVDGAIGSMKNCLETDIATLNESQFSFPSGHSSLIFAGLTLLCLYWLHVVPRHFMKGQFGTPSPVRFLPIKMSCMIALMISASFVAGTRTRDYWHNFDDILAGAVLGFGCGVFAFWLNRRRIQQILSENGKEAFPPVSLSDA